MSQSSSGRGVTGKAEDRNKGRADRDPFSNTCFHVKSAGFSLWGEKPLAWLGLWFALCEPGAGHVGSKGKGSRVGMCRTWGRGGGSELLHSEGTLAVGGN